MSDNDSHADPLSARPELLENPEWKRTGNAYFPHAATVRGEEWVLRINSFPDHLLWTLFISGTVRFDIEPTPANWESALGRSSPLMDADTAQRILSKVEHLTAWGSEYGTPCDGGFCCG